jgi:hypothetical protein
MKKGSKQPPTIPDTSSPSSRNGKYPNPSKYPLGSATSSMKTHEKVKSHSKNEASIQSIQQSGSSNEGSG